MSTLVELRIKYRDDQTKLKNDYKRAVEARLKELKLNNEVIRLADGKRGVLLWGCYGSLEFYPITKKGEVSQRASGYFFDAETEFKPAEEVNTNE